MNGSMDQRRRDEREQLLRVPSPAKAGKTPEQQRTQQQMQQQGSPPTEEEQRRLDGAWLLELRLLMEEQAQQNATQQQMYTANATQQNATQQQMQQQSQPQHMMYEGSESDGQGPGGRRVRARYTR